jgi:hypothetical protein
MDFSDVGERLFSDARQLLQYDADDPRWRGVCHESLRSLGFDLQRLDSLSIGLFASPSVMQEGLLRAGFCREEIVASGLVRDPRVAKRLIGPIRNVGGQIISFWARHPEGLPPKYLFFRRGWQQEVPAFGLDVALSYLADGVCELLLVEDILDALLLQSAGLPQTAATLLFSRNLTRARWEQLAVLGVERVTLVPSDEREGLARAALAREASLQGSLAPEVFVLLPECFGRVKNLAKMILAMTCVPFWSWLKDNRVPRTDDLLATTPTMRAGVSLSAVPPLLPIIDQDSSETQRSKEPTGDPTPEPRRPHSSEICALHHCDPMFCFCWD